MTFCWNVLPTMLAHSLSLRALGNGIDQHSNSAHQYQEASGMLGRSKGKLGKTREIVKSLENSPTTPANEAVFSSYNNYLK